MRAVSNSIHVFYYTGPYASALMPDAEQVRARLAPERRERLDRQRAPAQQALSLAAWRLLELAIHRCGHPEFRLADVNHPLDAKPFWNNAKQVDFSISHARGIALCAVAENMTVGCDAEDRARLDERLTKRLLAATAPRMPCWTEIEAVVKAANKGIMHGPEIVWSDTADALFEGQRWWCYRVDCGDAHVAHVAANQPNVNVVINEVSEL